MAEDGQKIRRIDLAPEGPARGSILFMAGRGDAYEKYLETLAHWRAKGWRVTAADWRGQAGSGRLGADHVAGHVDDFGRWTNELGEFWRDWAATVPGPHILAGHSMGGHLALRAVADRTVVPDGLVLSAPMLGFTPKYLPAPLLRAAAWVMTKLGDPRRLAWKWSEKPLEVPKDRILLLTHDEARYADELFWRAERPQIAMGPGSWGWVLAAYRSMAGLMKRGRLEAVRVPVFIAATANDGLVDPQATVRAAQRLPDCELLLFGEEARHEVLREVDPVRDRALAGIDAFLLRIAEAWTAA